MKDRFRPEAHTANSTAESGGKGWPLLLFINIQYKVQLMYKAPFGNRNYQTKKIEIEMKENRDRDERKLSEK